MEKTYDKTRSIDTLELKIDNIYWSKINPPSYDSIHHKYCIYSLKSFCFVVNMRRFDFPSYLPLNMRGNIKGNIFVGNNEANCTRPH